MSVPHAKKTIYVASPITTYHTSRYDRLVSRVRKRFPEHRVLAARDLGFTPENWLRRWSRLLPTLNRVVAFTDTSRVMGAGVFQEVFDARVMGIPVHFITNDSRLVPLHRLPLRFLGGNNLKRFARIIRNRRRVRPKGPRKG